MSAIQPNKNFDNERYQPKPATAQKPAPPKPKVIETHPLEKWFQYPKSEVEESGSEVW